MTAEDGYEALTDWAADLDVQLRRLYVDAPPCDAAHCWCPGEDACDPDRPAGTETYWVELSEAPDERLERTAGQLLLAAALNTAVTAGLLVDAARLLLRRLR